MYDQSRSNVPTTGTGASPAGAEQSRKRLWWLWILITVIVIVALILLLSRCGGGDDISSDAAGAFTSAAGSATSAAGSAAGVVTGSPSTSGTDNAVTSAASTPATTTSATTATPGAPAGAGALTANGTSLLPIATAAGAGGDLSKYVGQAAAAAGVVVLSAPADNGFWVGTSDTDRVYVHLLQPGLVSPHPVHAGNRVLFAGQVVANNATVAADDGVDAAEGAAQLTAQEAHIETAKSAVMFAN